MATGSPRRTGIVACGYSATWSGDLLAAQQVTHTSITATEVPTIPEQKALDAERAAAEHVAFSRTTVTRKLLVDVLTGLHRL
ncbi:hypothetical protein [Saccharopolyspora pogona]|uniref:hypothetical protein n=1 Tax=Saccharopolyspora pogona TaxID=333966 RepID=UPI0016889270|nr:hypothetical protein [Saccharopolyspora pogona]